ncbi:hypothetical protein ACVWXQ_005967 [Bradyrhizobium sp. S3.14.4]
MELSRPSHSTAAVSCPIGRVNDRASSTASMAATSTAMRPIVMVDFSMVTAGAMKTALGTTRMTPTHWSSARIAGAIAVPLGLPSLPGTTWVAPSVDPVMAAK